MRGVIPPKLFAAMVAALLCAAFSYGQVCPGGSGCLDDSFDGDGLLAVSIPDSNRGSVRKIAAHTDGSIVALFDNRGSDNLGHPVMARFFGDGTLDTGFGVGGFVFLDWPSVGSGGPKNLVVQNDGKVVVVGYSPLGRNAVALRLHRYNYDGTPDNTFGSGGVAAFNVTGSITLSLLPGGKILTMNADGKLVRLNTNGSLDLTFGSGGIASSKLALSPWYGGLASLPSGKIVATGHTVVGGVYQFTVAGYNANGSLDDGSKADPTPGNQFGSKGSTIVSFPGYSGGRGYSLRVDSSGSVVVMGAAGTQNTTTALVRLTSSGQLDTSFAGTGRLVFSHANGLPQGSALDLQSDGRIVVIGGFWYPTTQTRDAMVLRFTTDGTLDAFATGPFVLNDVSGVEEVCYDGAVVVGDRILWAGAVTDKGAFWNPLIMRFLP